VVPKPWDSTLGIFVARDMLTTMRILVVEDEKKVASFIKHGLEATHYSAGTQTPSIQAKGRRLVFRLGLPL
jgi:hypothetical protein